jgi:hypothetical protein
MTKNRVTGRGMKIAGAGLACALLALGGWFFLTRYYLPLREVRPIVKLLEEGTSASVQAANDIIVGDMREHDAGGRTGYSRVEHRISIRGVGFEKVKQGILKVLAFSGDPETLFLLFNSIELLAEAGHTGFRTEADGATIRKAMERYNAKQGEYGRFTLTTNVNGAYIFLISRPPIP